MGKWRAVEEDLPQDDKLKIVKYCRNDTGQHVGVALSHYRKCQVSGHYDFDFNYSVQPIRVTHWASIPKG